MLFMLIIIFVMLGMLDQAIRGGRLDLLIQRTRYRLFEIRDILRRAAIDREVSIESPLFKYLDTSLSKTARFVSEINIKSFLKRLPTGQIKIRMSEEPEELQRLISDLQKPGNQKFEEIHRMYSECLADFIAHRHPILLRVFMRGLFLFVSKHDGKPTSSIQSLRYNSAKELTVDPEFSTFRSYCQQN